MTWQSGLPAVVTTAAAPARVTPKKVCPAAAARQAYTAARTSPPVPFFNPIRFNTTGERAVRLALGAPRADRPPRHGFFVVLLGDRLQPLAADRQSQRDHVEQE